MVILGTGQVDSFFLSCPLTFLGGLMPLKKGYSNATRNMNIAKEINAGKSPEQAAAIGYSVQRENKKKEKNHDETSRDRT
jgi:predicted NAD-dependent protein-ADP-ribosyltransferase YbiA (DUF1768 family)